MIYLIRGCFYTLKVADLKDNFIYLSTVDKQKWTSQMKETFGEYIRNLRKKNRYTLTQLAAKLDLDSANLSKIENGKRNFDEKRLKKMALVFNLNLKTLKNEFYSDLIAKKLHENNCDKEALILAEQKIENLRQKE